jgi:hypothetical protein
MVEDIHNRVKNLDRNTDRYISKLFADDQEDARRFINDLLAQGYSAGRVDKYLSSLVSISRILLPHKWRFRSQIKSDILSSKKFKLDDNWKALESILQKRDIQ